MNMFKNVLFLMVFVIAANSHASRDVKSYGDTYAVVVSKETYLKKEWKLVADTLITKHDADLILFQNEVEEVLPALKTKFPKYVCFVTTPEEAGFAWIVRTHRLLRKMDSDPYADAIHSTITGYTPEDALRVASATLPVMASRALISAGVGIARYKEAYYLSTGVKGEHGHKKEDGTVARKNRGDADLTQFFVESWNTLDPDIVITSAHASQRNLEMPFSQGNIICKEGKLYGYITNKRMIGADGQAKTEKVKGVATLLSKPKNPKVYFAVGNCLIGDIPDKNCMALAWMGYGHANQMTGYTATTWFGMVGWGTNKIWEQSGGEVPLNESFYFSNAALISRLNTFFPETINIDFDYDKKMDYATIKDSISEVLSKSTKAEVVHENIGMLWDRDVVAFYGDPKLEVFLDKAHTIKATRSISISEAAGVYTVTIKAHAKHDVPKWDSPPVSIFLPHRVKNIKLLKGSQFKPVITDNFVMVMAPGAWAAGVDYIVQFTADKL